MKLDGLNPFIRYAKLHSRYIPPRTNNVCLDCRLFYLLDGEGVLSVNGVEYAMSSNTSVFLPPESHYRFSFRDAQRVKIYVIDFDLTDAYSELEESLTTASEVDFSQEKVLKYPIPEPFRGVCVLHGARGVKENVAGAVELFLERDPYFRERASALVKLALLGLIAEAEGGVKDGGPVERAIGYIRKNFASTSLSNKQIAEQLHYHPYYISRVMKEQTGMTLGEYITDYRLRMAKNYLITTSASVTEIAEMCGFGSYTYFIRIFRESTGLSPLRYRRKMETAGF